MSFVLAIPDVVGTAAADVAGIGSALNDANAVAASATTGVLAAGGDEVSAAVASLFSSHALSYQQLATRATAFQAPAATATRADPRAGYQMFQCVSCSAGSRLAGRKSVPLV